MQSCGTAMCRSGYQAAQLRGALGSVMSGDAAAEKSQRKLEKKEKKRKAANTAAAPAGDPTDVAANGAAATLARSSFKKKLKKQKRTADAAAIAALAEPSSPTADAAPDAGPPANGTSNAAAGAAAPDAVSDKASRKAEKKARKAAKLAAAATGGAAAAPPEADPSAGANGAIGAPSAKLNKKERKRLAAAAAAAAANATSQPKARKAKKAMSTGRAAGLLASVGDVALARSSKPIVRSTYTEHPSTAAQAAEDVITFREGRSTVVSGTDLRPIREFAHSGFGPELLKSCAAFATPSPIQTECWAPACSGADLVGIAATGSGKTLAFGLPALAHVRAQLAAKVVDGRTPSVLVIAPTRELAVQIAEVLESAGKPIGVTTLCVYGGVPKQPQAKTLRSGVNVLVATPGRLKDLMDDNAARLHQTTFLVLDEADRMLDLGFEPDIRAIAGRTRADRQTLMFSATWPPAIQRLAAEFLCAPVRVTIGSADLSASHSVSQVVEVIDPRHRDRRLLELLHKYHGPKRANRIIVFVLYKKEAARVEASLNRAGWKAVAVHGDATQAARSAAVDSFKAGSVKLLIATDVAARGLDIPDVEVVINYSFPLTTEDYVHRIGRTGRAGKTGAAHTFFSGETDKARAGELINVLREAQQPVPEALLAFGTTVKKKESKLYGAHFKDVDFSRKATKIKFDIGDSEDESF